MYKGVIYKATNTLNGKCYIGLTSRDFNIRKKEHFRSSSVEKDQRYNSVISRAIRKHGWGNFEWEIIENIECEHICELTNILNRQETYWIEYYNSRVNGYNSTDGGEGTRGYKMSEDTRTLLSKLKTGESNPNYGKFGPLNHCYGMKRSDEFKRRVSEGGKKAICQYSLDGSLIKKWESATDAQHYFNITANSISSCCRGKTKTGDGYVWRYKDDPFDKYDTKNRVKRAIIQLTKNGEFVCDWDSAKSASDFINIPAANITQACKETWRTAGGFKWQYKKED